jgi:hypothetical protein
MARAQFLGDLRRAAVQYDTENIVYFDESSFACSTQRGKQIFAEVQGRRTKKTTLIMAQRGKEWLAPLLFQGSSAAMTIERWIEKGLLPLPPYSPDLNPI